MSSYNPPTQINSVFNESFYSSYYSNLTQAEADLLYFKLTGSICVGLATFNAGLRANTLTIFNTTNQLVFGTTNTVTISSTAPAAPRTYTLPDAGGAANFILSTFGSAQTIAGGLTSSGTFTASNGLTLTTGALNVTSTSGAISLTGTTFTSDGTLTSSKSTNQLSIGSTYKTTINSSAAGQNQTISIPNSGTTASNFILSDATAYQTINSGLLLSGTPGNNSQVLDIVPTSITTSSGLNAINVFIDRPPLITGTSTGFYCSLYIDAPTASYNAIYAIRTVNGLVSFENTTNATSYTSAPVYIAGGLGVAKKIYTNSDINMSNTAAVLRNNGTTDASSYTTGSVIFDGGVGIAKKLYTNSDVTMSNTAAVLRNSGTTDASSSTTGSVIFSGGVGIAKKLYVGTGIYLPTSGGTASQLNYYEEATATGNLLKSGTANDFYTVSTSITIYITRIGRLVCIQFPDPYGTTAAAGIMSLPGIIPSRFRQGNGKNNDQIISAVDNGVYKRAIMEVEPTGDLKIYSEGFTNFSSGNIVSMNSSSITYYI